MNKEKDIIRFVRENNVPYRDLLSAVIKEGVEHYPREELEYMTQITLDKLAKRSSLREYRDRFFKLLFSDKTRLLSLYNALNHSNYENEDDLIFVTLEFGICIGMRNDLAYVLLSNLYIYEAQSTKNQNMPLRMLLYVADMYRSRVRHRDLFKDKCVMIETPHFITFYSGDDIMKEDEVILKLSDSYISKTKEEPELELKVRVLNINKGHNKVLLEACESLHGYSELVEAVRRYRGQNFSIDRAVVSAIDYCIENNILKDFFAERREEVISMLMEIYTIEDLKKDLIDEVEEAKAEAEGAKAEAEEARAEAQKTKTELNQMLNLLLRSYRDSGKTKEETVSLLMENTQCDREKAEKIVGQVFDFSESE